ncbi:hypothetical protein KUW76_005242 [Escherichia coli]|nr:hypothetical protein [Escherichia coli]
MTALIKHADLINLLDQQTDLTKLFLRVLWKTLALPPEDELWQEVTGRFLEMCNKTHHKRLINLLENHRDFFEPAFTALYRQEPPLLTVAISLSGAARGHNEECKDFHHELQELTDQMRDILHR